MRSIVLPLFIVHLFFILPSGHAQTQANATLASTVGQVEVDLAGTGAWSAASVNRKVDVGGQIKTSYNGSVLLVFGDGSKLRLGPNGRLRIDALAADKTVVSISTGRAEAWVKKNRNRRFFLRSPVAVALPRDGLFTVFALEAVSATKSILTHYVGHLDLTDSFGRPAPVSPGYGVEASDTGGALEPVALHRSESTPAEPTID